MDECYNNQVSIFNKVFSPKSIAIVGASNHKSKLGNFVLRSVIKSNVTKIYPIHRGGAEEILGIKAYSSIQEIPENEVDLFLFAIPKKNILSSFEEAIKKGCKGAVIYSAGFREADEIGKKEQQILKQMADSNGVKIIGPNTLGFYNAHSNINATFIPLLSDINPVPGKITLVSQSGGVAGFAGIKYAEEKLPLGKLICLGNRANVEFADILYYLAHDTETEVVTLFIEGLDDVRKFYAAAKYCAQKKPVIVLGAGYTKEGQKLAKSHTGSMANSEKIYQGVFKQAGLIQVNSVEELIDTGKIMLLSPKLKGNKVAIITHTAGPAIIASDIMSKGGLKLAPLSEHTKHTLKEKGMLADFMPADNPVDLTTFGYLLRNLYVDTFELLASDENVDAVLAICMSSLKDENLPSFPAKDLGELIKKYQIPLVMAWGAPIWFHEEFENFFRANVPVYPSSERAARAITNLYNYFKLQKKDKKSFKLNIPDELILFVKNLKKHSQTNLMEHQTKQLLELAGINVARSKLVKDEKEACELAKNIGYPVVLKIVSRDIPHKSDVGGVELNISNEESLLNAYKKIINSVKKNMPYANIKGLSIQPMIPKGTEVIIGGLLDPQAGPVVMLGLGGIFVEALKDVTFRLAPLTEDDVYEMIEELKGACILEGYRDLPPVNKDKLVKLVCIISQLIYNFKIKELDLNPIIFHSNTYTVVDARIVL